MKTISDLVCTSSNYSENLSSGKSFTVKHFMKEKIPQRTIYDILKRYEMGLSAFRQSGSGRVAKIFTRKKIGNLKKNFDQKDQMSQRQAAMLLDVETFFICLQ